MNTKVVAAGVLAAACIAAAAGGAYLAVRHNAPVPAQPAPAALAVPTPQSPAAAKPVSETEAIVTPPSASPEAAPARGPVAPAPREIRPAAEAMPAPRKPAAQTPPVAARKEAPRSTASGNGNPAPASAPPVAERTPEREIPAPPPAIAERQEPARPSEPAPPEVQFEEVVLPASTVIGLRVETPLSSERTRLEDRVEARVTRDVSADGHLAIPAGSRVIGSVTLVEPGGKMKERARLGVRFHTVVLANGREVPLRTDVILREGESPSAESARKIGGAAIGGAILGAIIGGGKGAAIGTAAGAAGGSAAVMAGDRNAATLPVGTIVSVRLSAPASIEVEKR